MSPVYFHSQRFPAYTFYTYLHLIPEHTVFELKTLTTSGGAQNPADKLILVSLSIWEEQIRSGQFTENAEQAQFFLTLII